MSPAPPDESDGSHLLTGRSGEDCAEQFLRGLGFAIVCRNYRCRFGELDIIARRAGVLHVVEVKTRMHPLAHPEEAVTPGKRRRLIRAAQCFLESYAVAGLPCQFDILAVHRDDHGGVRVQWFEDAFPGGEDAPG